MKRPRSPALTFTEKLATLDCRGKKAPRASREVKPAPTIEGQKTAAEFEPQLEHPLRSSDLDEFLTVPEVARILRFTDRHIRDLIDEGKIVRHQFEGAVRISRADFQAYIASCRRSKEPKNCR